ncbi:MAG: hypothetical protein J0H68_09920 [Sphingobacteriia bacterium]|nr:hypothetical protein [Sphingobacteriia bacterium]
MSNYFSQIAKLEEKTKQQIAKLEEAKKLQLKALEEEKKQLIEKRKTELSRFVLNAIDKLGLLGQPEELIAGSLVALSESVKANKNDEVKRLKEMGSSFLEKHTRRKTKTNASSNSNNHQGAA